jgi:LuxR family glucitol operon transcriptional activator
MERLRIAHLVQDQTQLEPLLEATGGNPKAITMVAGLLKYERRPLQQIIDDLYAARGDLFDDLFSRAWTLLDEAGRHILMVMTFFLDSASSEALSKTADVKKFDFDRATERLTDLSLLDVQQANLASMPRYVLHPLVWAFAGAQLAEQPDFERVTRERWMRWYVHLVSLVWNEQRGNLEHIPLLDTEHMTTTAAMEWTISQHLYHEAHCLSNSLRYYYNMRGPYHRKEYANTCQIAVTRHLGDFGEAAHAYSEHVQSLCSQERLDEAKICFDEMTQLLVFDPSQEEVQFWIDYTSAIINITQQCLDAAQQKLELCMIYADRMFPSIRSSVRRRIAEVVYACGELSIAEEWYHDALSIAIEYSIPREVVHNRLGLVMMSIDQGQYEMADFLLAQCIDNYPNYPDQSGRGQMKLFDARLHTLRSELPEAHAALTEAIDLFERMGMRRELAEAREELARLEAQMAEAAE